MKEDSMKERDLNKLGNNENEEILKTSTKKCKKEMKRIISYSNALNSPSFPLETSPKLKQVAKIRPPRVGFLAFWRRRGDSSLKVSQNQ